MEQRENIPLAVLLVATKVILKVMNYVSAHYGAPFEIKLCTKGQKTVHSLGHGNVAQ